jgi:hypothetical protein
MRSPMTDTLHAAAAALALAATTTALAAEPPGGAVPRAALEVAPRDIQVGTFYRGTRVHVEGVAPAGYRLALVCLGAEKKVELKRKGKVAQVLWMSVGDVSFEHVPSLYLSAYEPGEGAARAEPAAKYDHIEAQILPAGVDADTRRLFRELVKLKEEEQLYSSAPPRLERGAAGSRRIAADFWMPASAPAGTYEVRLLGERDGASEVLAADRLITRRAGLVSLVASAAEEHGLVYGILAVLVAIAAGFLTGVVFASAKKGH